MFNNANGFVMPVAPTGYSNGGGMFGNGDEWIGLIIVLALLSGGFGNGFGFGGFGGFGGGRVEPYATQADVRAAVDQQTLISKIDQQTYGMADSFTALNNTLNNNFRGIDNAVCTLGYQNQQGFSNLSAQLAQCCCDNRAAIADVKYQMATEACDTRNSIANSTRDIIDNANANNRALLDFLVNDKISILQAENQALKFKASQAEQNAFITANQQAQTAELIRRLGADCPTPAYVVQPPQPVTFPVNSCGQFNGYGYNGACGCA